MEKLWLTSVVPLAVCDIAGIIVIVWTLCAIGNLLAKGRG